MVSWYTSASSGKCRYKTRIWLRQSFFKAVTVKLEINFFAGEVARARTHAHTLVPNLRLGILVLHPYLIGASGGAIVSGTALTSLKVAALIPNGVTGNFVDIILPAALWP